MVKNKIILFELWKTCKNHCLFCVDRLQKESIESVNRNFDVFLYEAKNINECEAVGMLGGELFDGTMEDLKITDKFYDLLNVFIDKYNNNKLKQICMTSNFLYIDLTPIKNCITYLINHGILQKDILLTTSYDTKGRFLKKDSESIWKSNTMMMRNLFPDIHYHCEIILTNDFCEQVLYNKFHLDEFKSWWKSTINFNQPYVGLKFDTKEEFEKVCPNFFLKRNIFLKFCKYLQRNEMFNLEDLFFGTNTADVTLMVKNDYGSVIIEKNKFINDAMGREKKDFGYIDSDKDIFEDIKRITNTQL